MKKLKIYWIVRQFIINQFGYMNWIKIYKHI